MSAEELCMVKEQKDIKKLNMRSLRQDDTEEFERRR
jgi:hypothetical protein